MGCIETWHQFDRRKRVCQWRGGPRRVRAAAAKQDSARSSSAWWTGKGDHRLILTTGTLRFQRVPRSEGRPKGGIPN